MTQQQSLDEFSAGSIDWGSLVVMRNMMPPRDPDEDDEDEEDEEEPPIAREPDED